jgi:glycolate oxidase
MKTYSLDQTSSASVYFLKDQRSTLNALEIYQDLMHQFVDQGDFLTFESHAEWLACYQHDSQQLKTRIPLLVFRPHSTDRLDPFIQECYHQCLPIKVRCGGTSLTGASVTHPGGILLLTNHFNRILNYSPESGLVRVEPGVTISQLNYAVGNDRWEFPLQMATNGVAGLGACLSSRSRGYHQSDRNFYGAIQSAVLIDGSGKRVELPGRLLSGMEGQLGVIVQLDIQLAKIPERRLSLAAKISWGEVMEQREALRQHQCLKSILWGDEKAVFRMEGDHWRIDTALELLTSLFSHLQFELIHPAEYPFQPTTQLSSLHFSDAVPAAFLTKARAHWHALAASTGLNLQLCVDCLSGALHIRLASMDQLLEFSRKIEGIMESWIEFLKKCGVDPYYGEEDWQFWTALQRLYDPHQLYLS